ncbi:hypothetical protein GYB57_04545 [bacterium]|nr:hypothetical protein [bacterium]
MGSRIMKNYSSKILMIIVICQLMIISNSFAQSVSSNETLKESVVNQSSADSLNLKIFVEFIIDTSGYPTQVEIKKTFCEECDENQIKQYEAEAIRVVKEMPAWEPPFKDGKPQRVKYILPIKFSYSK